MMKKKILIVVNSLKIGGGAQKQAVEIGSNLERKGHDVTFLIMKNIEPTYDHQGKVISYDPLGEYRYTLPIRLLLRARKISKTCSKREIDTVISFMVNQNLSAILSKTFFGNKAKIIVSVRNNPVKNYTKNSQKFIKLLHPKADKVIAQTKKIEDILNKQFSIEDTTVIPNMSDRAKFKKMSKKAIREDHKDIFDEDFIFITVGSLTEQKAHWYLLRCFKNLSKNNRNVKLVILGDGTLREKLEKLTKSLGLENEVFFLGKVENVFPYLKNSDCFVLTSFYEGFPNVITEALSQNLPVISTDCVSGPREILSPELEMGEKPNYPYYGKFGILIKTFEDKTFFKTLKEEPLSKQEEILAEMMEEFTKDEKLRETYSNGWERVGDFKRSKIISKWESII